MHGNPIAAALLAGLALAGCAAGYRPGAPTAGGFREARLAEDAWRVEMRGSPLSGPRWVNEAALVRAAELTREAGFRGFVVLNDLGVLRTMGAAPGPPGFYSTAIVVRMYREGEPGSEGALDPDKVLRAVGPRVGYRPSA